MKFLDYPELEQLSRQLTFDSAECRVFTRLEAYSCKAVTRDKKLLKALESTYGHAASSTSPPSVLEEHLASPFGKLDQPAARKTLWLLIATLNGAFPDHDFTQANPADFRRERSVDYVINSLSSTLVSLRSGSGGSFSLLPSTSYEEGAAALSHSGSYGSPPSHFGTHRLQTDATLGAILEDILCVSECEVFTYSPDMDSDPHAYPDPDEGYMDGEEDTWVEDDYSLFDSGAQSLEDDTPMFDEDMDGSIGRAGPSTSFSSASDADPKTPENSPFEAFSTRLRLLPKRQMVEMEDPNGGGLLWSTYVFFYNRKLKRILFVEVWARRRATPRLRPSFPSHSAPTYSLGPSKTASVALAHHHHPVQAQAPGSRKGSEALHLAHPSSSAIATPLATPLQSPAKRAVGRASVGRKRRAPSGSPAPSSLSPFPHASPQALSEARTVLDQGHVTSDPLVESVRASSAVTASAASAAAATASGGAELSGSLSSGTGTGTRSKTRIGSALAGGAMQGLDGAMMSASAPASAARSAAPEAKRFKY